MPYTIGDLLREPNARQLFDAVRSGWTIDREGDIIRGWFPGYSDRTLRLGLDRYLQARQAASSLSGLTPEQALFREDIPVNATIPAAYQFTLAIDFVRPGTGVSTRETVQCDQATLPTAEQVADCGRDILARMLRMEGRSSDYIGQAVAAIAFVTPETVFRRT